MMFILKMSIILPLVNSIEKRMRMALLSDNSLIIRFVEAWNQYSEPFFAALRIVRRGTPPQRYCRAWQSTRRKAFLHLSLEKTFCLGAYRAAAKRAKPSPACKLGSLMLRLARPCRFAGAAR